MGIFGSKNKKGDISINLEYIDGIPSYPAKAAVAVSLNINENVLEVKTRAYKEPPVKLGFDQIISFDTIDEKTIIEKQKSVVGRAFIGTVFLGAAGAIIGGLSALDPKKITKNNLYLILNYSKKDTDEVKVLTFKIVGATLHLNKFIEKLGQIAPLDIKKIQAIKEKYNINENNIDKEKPKEIIL